MTDETHFVQAGDGPVLIGTGGDTLSCSCGNPLISGYDPARFLAIGLQCGQCGALTMTPSLPNGRLPPRSAIIAAPSPQPRTTAMTLPPDVTMVGQAEMSRLQAFFQPASPDNAYRLSAALLDEVEASFARHTGGTLPSGPDRADDPFAGLRDHALGWAVRHLRTRMSSGSMVDMQDPPTANAVTHVTGFLHFVSTWSRHPLFPVMVETAGDRGFSLHGLAPFAVAHCLIMMGNQIRFPEMLGYPQRIERFSVVAEPDSIGVHVEILDRFAFPFGQAWDPSSLRAAVSDLLAGVQGQINLRNPGILVLSPGAALTGFDEMLIEAIKVSVQALGRKNRGLMTVAPIVLRLQAMPEPGVVRFGYGFFPIANRHYRGPALPQVAS